MLGYANGESISSLSKRLGMTRKSVGKWVDRALEVGVYAAIEDAPHGAEPTITEAAKAWALSVACQKPKDLGYAAEVWSRSALAAHLRKHARAAGHPSLARAAKATVQRLLREHALQPQKVAYYLERRDPQFEQKMAEVVAIYTEVATTPPAGTVTISVDPKNGSRISRDQPKPQSNDHFNIKKPISMITLEENFQLLRNGRYSP
jgi:transposase